MSTAQGRSRIRGQITGLNVIYQRLNPKQRFFRLKCKTPRVNGKAFEHVKTTLKFQGNASYAVARW